jgi:hypothetical protein
MKTRIIVMAVLVVMLALPMALYAQETDPESIVRAAGDALVAGDVDAALANLTDDVVVTIIPPPEGTTGVLTGKEETRAWYEQLVAWNFEAEFSNFQVVGNKATWTTKACADPFRALGICPLEYHAEAVFEGGKIKSYTDTMTPESLEKLQAAMAALPVTGGSNPTGTLPLWLGVGGLLLLALGVGLRWAFSRAR